MVGPRCGPGRAKGGALAVVHAERDVAAQNAVHDGPLEQELQPGPLRPPEQRLVRALLGHLAASAGKGNIRWFPGGLLALLIAPFLGLPGMVALLVMAAAAWLVGRRAKALLAGQTGDVLGTVQLCSEIAGWVVLSAAL